MSRTNHREREANRTRGVYDKSCRNHGSCSYCKDNRTFFDTKHRESAESDLHEYLSNDDCSVCEENEDGINP